MFYTVLDYVAALLSWMPVCWMQRPTATISGQVSFNCICSWNFIQLCTFLKFRSIVYVFEGLRHEDSGEKRSITSCWIFRMEFLVTCLVNLGLRILIILCPLLSILFLFFPIKRGEREQKHLSLTLIKLRIRILISVCCYILFYIFCTFKGIYISCSLCWKSSWTSCLHISQSKWDVLISLCALCFSFYCLLLKGFGLPR